MGQPARTVFSEKRSQAEPEIRQPAPRVAQASCQHRTSTAVDRRAW
ncbi:hypothetical protein FTUN_7840 [Frigoriglobus tundricola]|uniref:Uncharacterized protein n=1 Tax=Frigoriglobus tundricola TaxID=2774151 RepID=A0A6M5Z2C4_9BACT|nr:hypothetical protein FTUN_7840 [Frigoriglobus tundricola]